MLQNKQQIEIQQVFKETVKINEELIKAGEQNPTKRSLQMPVKQILEYVDKNEFVLPIYQTGIRWTIEKSLNLMNAQMLGKAPIAPLSMLYITKEKENEVEQINLIDRSKVRGDLAYKYSIIDGQQRIVTNLRAYLDDKEFKNIVLDLVEGKFKVINKELDKEDHQIPIGKLLNKDYSVFEKYALSNDILKANFPTLFVLRNKLHTYNYIINIAEDLTEDEQLQWFEDLNNAGSKIPKVQVETTTLTKKEIDIHVEYIDKFINILKINGMQDLIPKKNSEFSIPVATLNTAIERKLNKTHSLNWSPIPSDVKVKELCELSRDEIIEVFNQTLDGLVKVVDFIKVRNLKIKRIDYITYLTGWFVYNIDRNITEDRYKKAIEWIEMVEFKNKSNSDRRKSYDLLLKI